MRTPLAILFAALLAGCAPGLEPRPFREEGPPPTPRGFFHSPGWAPENRAKVEAFLAAHGCSSPGYDPLHPPTATFDWDMTSIFNDIGDATFYHQVRSPYLALEPSELEAILPDTLQKTGASLAEEKREILAAYSLLHAANVVGKKSLGKDHQLDASQRGALDRFAYDMIALYEKLESVDGPPVAYPWLVRLYKNLAPTELARLQERVLAEELRAPGELCTKVTLTRENKPPIEIPRGIVASPEIRELMAALRANGFDVYVVTASFKGAVERIAMTYGVRPDHVVGIRLEALADGTLTDKVPLPITYRAGKVENIKLYVPRPPLFAAGDSDTDVEMLTQESVQLRLILDRKKSPASDMGKLYERARVSDRDHYMIQGRNDYGRAGTAAGTWNGTTETR